MFDENSISSINVQQIVLKVLKITLNSHINNVVSFLIVDGFHLVSMELNIN